MPDPELIWKLIADALAVKLKTVTGMVDATSLPEDSMPSSFPVAIVWPPDLTLDEELSMDAYDAVFDVDIAFSNEGGAKQTLAAIYAVLDDLVLAFRTGSTRQLGLPTLVTNSKIKTIAPTVVTQWGEPGLPGLALGIEVTVRQVVAPRS